MQPAITKQKIEELLQENAVVKLIDIRPEAEYEKMHVPDSLNLPAETIKDNITRFSKSDMIVCVCTKGLERSQNAAETIHSMGYENVFYLKDGALGWVSE